MQLDTYKHYDSDETGEANKDWLINDYIYTGSLYSTAHAGYKRIVIGRVYEVLWDSAVRNNLKGLHGSTSLQELLKNNYDIPYVLNCNSVVIGKVEVERIPMLYEKRNIYRFKVIELLHGTYIEKCLNEESSTVYYDNNRTVTFKFKYGRMHCDNGPAVMCHGLFYYWLIHGQLHREDGPAQEDKNSICWYKNGLIHRDVGPAKITKNSMRWYRHGKTHRVDGPAYVSPHKKIWVQNGRKHRVGAPAVEYIDGNCVWYTNGIQDRSYVEPMKEYKNGEIIYGINGYLHRDDGPAYENTRKKELIWSIHGNFHRVNGPAKYQVALKEEWFFNGNIHRIGGPACDVYYGSKYWYVNNIQDRTDGPAIMRLFGYKNWVINNQRHRIHGPAIIDILGGIEEWYYSNELHRNDGPAVTVRCPFTNNIIYQEWFSTDKRHRIGRPAVEFNYDTVSAKIWFHSGKLHNEAGPAIEFTDGTKSWYIHDKRKPNPDDYIPVLTSPKISSRAYQTFFISDDMLFPNNSTVLVDERQKEYLVGDAYLPMFIPNATGLYYNDIDYYLCNIRSNTVICEVAVMIQNIETKPESFAWYKKILQILHGEIITGHIIKTIYRFHYGKLHCTSAPAIQRSNGTNEWYFLNERHRIDGPAIEYCCSRSNTSDKRSTEWWYFGKLHREDGPAIEKIEPNDDREEKWYRNGRCHREDGPAVIRISHGQTTLEWYLHGIRHREDGPAFIDKHYGREEWYLYGKRHRADGPSIITKTSKEWYVNGTRHNDSGPAIVLADGTKRWYIGGVNTNKSGASTIP